MPIHTLNVHELQPSSGADFNTLASELVVLLGQVPGNLSTRLCRAERDQSRVLSLGTWASREALAHARAAPPAGFAELRAKLFADHQYPSPHEYRPYLTMERVGQRPAYLVVFRASVQPAELDPMLAWLATTQAALAQEPCVVSARTLLPEPGPPLDVVSVLEFSSKQGYRLLQPHVEARQAPVDAIEWFSGPVGVAWQRSLEQDPPALF